MKITANKYIQEVKTIYGKKPEGEQRIEIHSPPDVVKLFQDLENETQEKFITLHLNNKGVVTCFQVVHIGTPTQATINLSDIFRTALLTGAVKLIIIHNHPSGDSKPSDDDIIVTKYVKKACELFNLVLADHIIIGEAGYFSFVDHRLI